MKKKSELTYHKVGDYYFPDLGVSESPRPFGRWGTVVKYGHKHSNSFLSSLINSNDKNARKQCGTQCDLGYFAFYGKNVLMGSRPS